MISFLRRFYLLTQNHSWLYPLYLLVRLPIITPRLISNEGFGGAFQWLHHRFAFLLANRKQYGQPAFYRQPIPEFRSRLGFKLLRPIEYIIYDEIFLDRCYAFRALADLAGKGPILVVDFGTHHGMFLDFMRVLNPNMEAYGAEMNPEAFEAAQQRFTGHDAIHLSNVAIGGTARTARVSRVSVSIEQSLYADGGKDHFEVEVILPVEFLRRWKLAGKEIAVLKMDIEGAEREVFANPDSIHSVLEATRSLIIEIHSENDVGMIAGKLNASGFSLAERRGINFLFRREKG